MPKLLKAGETHKNRPEGIRVVALSLDTEAYELLRELAPTSKSYGSYVSRLVHADHARKLERERILKVVAGD